MKILFFSYAYPNPANPDVGTFNRTMIAGLSQNNDVRVISPVPFLDAWKAWWQGRLRRGLNDSTFQAVPNVPAEYCRWYYTPKIFREHYGRFMQQSVRTTLNRAMETFRPDLVLSYWTYPDGEVAVKTAHQHGIRAVTIVGGTDVLINGRHGARRKATLNVLHAADGIIAVSDDIKNVLIADGIPAGKLSVVRRGIDYNLFHKGSKSEARCTLGLPEDRPILISVGRLVDVKGHSHLIEACRLLTERGLPFRCYLLGDGPLRSSLNQQIEEGGLSHFVQLRGSCAPAQLAEWYRAADVTVLPSISEGVPNVLLESIASGTPFVASRVGGIPEIADLLPDRLVPPADPGALANAIAERLASNSDSSGSSRRFEPPTSNESARQLSTVLRMIATGRSPLLTETAIMHETMTDVDLTTNRAVKTDANDVIPVQTDLDAEALGRTAERFYYSSDRLDMRMLSTIEAQP